jgi:hypothetical protein
MNLQINIPFNIEDRVFYLYNNSIHEGVVKHIKVDINSEGTFVDYSICPLRGGQRFQCSIERIFRSKQDLVNKLLNG